MENMIKIVLPEGYRFVKEEDGNLILMPKQFKYPESLKECAKIIDVDYCSSYISGYKGNKISYFQNLLICRDAYWKIAGDWCPDWDEETDKFTISNKCNKIYLNNTAWYSEVLAFPTAEMRDTFYDSFKNLIEQCKEFL